MGVPSGAGGTSRATGAGAAFLAFRLAGFFFAGTAFLAGLFAFFGATFFAGFFAFFIKFGGGGIHSDANLVARYVASLVDGGGGKPIAVLAT